MHGRTSALAVLPLSRHRELAVADLAASHRAPGALVLPIEGTWTYAPGISTGAVAVFVHFSAPSPGAGASIRPPRGLSPPRLARRTLIHHINVLMIVVLSPCPWTILYITYL